MTRGSTRISWSGPGLLEGGAWLTPAGFAGLQIGLPVGLVVGRLLWRTAAAYAPVQYVPPIATAVMASSRRCGR
jgi:hypothetical protein